MEDFRAFSQAELDEEGERLARMFEQAPGLMALLREPQHQIVLANAAFRSLFGGLDLVGRRVAEVLPPPLAPQALQALDEAYSTGSAIRRAPVKFPAPKPGEPEDERLVDLVLQPITDRSGAVMGIFVQGSDVTERIRAEQRVRSSLKISTVGIAYWDREYRLTEVNDAFLAMGRYARDDLLGKSWRHLTPPEFWPLVEKAMAELAAARESTPYEKQYYRRDGSRWWGRFDLLTPLPLHQVQAAAEKHSAAVLSQMPPNVGRRSIAASLTGFLFRDARCAILWGKYEVRRTAQNILRIEAEDAGGAEPSANVQIRGSASASANACGRKLATRRPPRRAAEGASCLARIRFR